MEFLSIRHATRRQLDQAAVILSEAFAHVPVPWREIASAREEVAAFLEPDRLAILAAESDRVLGWIGAIRHTPLLWEMHPLAVAPAHQRQGCGTRLVRALEAVAEAENVSTIWLGTDDDFGGTSIFGQELYPNVLERLQEIEPRGDGHPYVFYQKMGYAIIGAIPNATGFGKHDILMAKSFRQRAAPA